MFTRENSVTKVQEKNTSLIQILNKIQENPDDLI